MLTQLYYFASAALLLAIISSRLRFGELQVCDHKIELGQSPPTMFYVCQLFRAPSDSIV